VDAPADERERYEAYVEQLNAAERELEHVQLRAAALRKMVEAYTELYPNLASNSSAPAFDSAPGEGDRSHPAPQPKGPRGKRAVAQMMSETEELLTVGEIMGRLEQRGTAPASEEALRTTLNRMFKNDGKLEKSDKDGRLAYRWKRQ
jgi:hypothetical protein